MQTITPYLYYADVDAAMRVLAEAFGFEETLRYTGPEGYVSHAEMRLGDAEIMLGDPGDAYRPPVQLGASTHGTHLYLDDVDAVCERARAAGLEITEGPTDKFYGDRSFSARDAEGHEWFVATPMQDTRSEGSDAAATRGA
jgi:PhnB protein